ncbi:hypothetical protein BT96DRAFT_982979 [Gymnopus androsaceus JB14]|uniref:Transmembrane protein n=1 Tax=Gymnopus androsaceus JB14 TaxID=1447944 RepID=A0A6A4IR71_9AGAR|nr:hypothetical protein BT96DRAFT_982979 [Gymnopus androsaceus JB14]
MLAAWKANRQLPNVRSFSSKASLLTILHKTSNLLPRILPNSTSWIEPSSSSPPPARILICGTDKYAATEELVTALLEQPFLSDDSINRSLQTRWEARKDRKITIAYGKDVKWQGSTLFIPSSFLRQFPFPIEIEEYAAEYSPESLPEATWTTDVPLILCNPLTTRLSSLRLPSENPNARLVVTGNSLVPDGNPPNTLFIDPLRAINGLAAVRTDPTSPLNIQRYQDDYVRSRVPTLASHIKQSLLTPSDTSSPLELLQTRRREADEALVETTALSELVKETYIMERAQVLGVSDSSKEESLVTKAMTSSSRKMQAHMNRLSWLKMISRVDEINLVVNRLVDDVWCKDLEHQLIFQSGRLTSVQYSLYRENLHQIIESPSWPLKPNTLTSPIHKRRLQIAEYPTTRLHLAGQQAVIGMGASCLSGIGIAWTGWLGWLTGSGEGLLGIVAVDATTSIGLGMLTAVAGIRWGVGRWEKAKKMWWADWNRIGEGLERDLVASLDHALKHHVCAYPLKAHEGVSELAPKRLEEIVELRSELESIRKDFDKFKDV